MRIGDFCVRASFDHHWCVVHSSSFAEGLPICQQRRYRSAPDAPRDHDLKVATAERLARPRDVQ